MKAVRHAGEFLGRTGTVWRVEIWQDDFIGDVGDLTFDGSEAVTIEWDEAGKEVPVQGSRATLRVVSPGDRTYEHLYTIEPGTIGVDIYCGGALYWSGTLDPEFYQEPYERLSNYEVTLTFSDFGILDRLKYQLTGMQTLQQITAGALESARLGHVPVSTLISLGLDAHTPATLADLSVRSDNFTDEDGEQSTLREAVEAVLQPLALRMVQRGGRVWIYDINALATASESRPVTWSGDSQTLDADKVANEVRVTFSPYATKGRLTEELTFKGAKGQDLHSLAGDVAADGTQYYSYYPDLESHIEGTGVGQWDYGLINFTLLQHPTAGEGLAYKSPDVKYGRIEPGVSGPQACDCIVAAAAQGHQEDRHCKISSGSSVPVMRTRRVFIPKLSEAEAQRHYLRLSLEVMVDARYNPFTDGDVKNDNADDKLMKLNTAWAFVPVGVTIYDGAGTPLMHYENKEISYTSAAGLLSYARGEWKPGAAVYGDAWLEYYNLDDLYDDTGLRGWKTNRHNIGRPDHEWRKNVRYGTGRGFSIYDSFKQMPDGEYIPYPPCGGYLDITVFTGVRCFDYAEPGWYTDEGRATGEEMFNIPRKWGDKGLYSKMRWFLYKAPELAIVDKTLTLAETEQEDVEYKGWLNRAAQNPIEIDTTVGTTDESAPTARGVLCLSATGEQVTTLTRAGVTDHPERLLIGTLYSQYAERHTKLSGEADIDTGGLATYTEVNQAGKLFMIAGERQDLLAETSEIVIVEALADEYEAMVSYE